MVPAPSPPGLVGRGREWASLARAAEDAVAGRGGVVLLAGEPGIGKTRLLAEVRGLAARLGAATAAGTCVRSGRPWWPWRQAFRATDAAAVFDVERVDEDARAELFEAVVDRLDAAAEGGGLVLVFDDLQWADAASLRLLALVGRCAAVRRLLVVGAFRDVDVGHDHPLRAVLGELGAAASVLALDGLTVAAVAELLAEAGADPALAPAVHDRTRGNPFFVREVAQLVAAGDELGATVPVAVGEVVRLRIAAAGRDARQLLEAAAVAWTASDLALLAGALGVAAVDLVAPAEDLCWFRLLERTGAGYRFRHDLVRDAVLRDTDERRRAELSWAIGTRLLDQRVAERLEEAAALTRAGLSVGDPDIAVEAALRAARAAADGLAPELAANHLAWVLAQPRLARGIDRVEVLLALGEALRDAGDWARGGDAFEEAAAAAQVGDRPDQLARAALAFGAGLSGFEVHLRDERQIELLRRGAAALGNADSADLAYVLARLSVAVFATDAAGEREELARRALDVAERVGDPGALGHALAAWCDVISGPDHVDARLDAANRMVALGRAGGGAEITLLGRRFRAVALLERGDFATFDREIEMFAAVSGAARPLVRWYAPLWRGMRALMGGRVEEALARVDEVLATADRAGSENGHVLGMTLLLNTHDQAGRPLPPHVDAELDGYLAAVRAQPSITAQERALLLAAALVRDDLPAARVELGALVSIGFGDEDAEFLGTVTACGWAALRLGDHAAARETASRLRPYAELWVVDGIGAAVTAAVDEVLAALDLLLGSPGAGERLEAVARRYDEVGAPILAARARGWPAVVFAASGADRMSAVGADPRPDIGVLRREGSTWSASWAGREVRVPDSKGVRDCATLLAHPARELHVLELTGRVSSAAGGQALLDDTAIASYRQRVVDLHAEVEDAEDANDIARASRAAEELDAVLAELQRSLGLGGGSRTVRDDHERARQAVRARIRSAIGRFAAEHPALGRHLEASIHTGAFCSYRPERPTTWRVEL